MTYFETFAKIPDADIVMAVKQPPPIGSVAAVHASGGRYVYVPIDYFQSLEAIGAAADVLRSVDMVLVHSDKLLPHLRHYSRRLGRVDHHARDALPELAMYKPEGFVLWVGMCENLPHLMQWIDKFAWPPEFNSLTNLNNQPSRMARICALERWGSGSTSTDDAVNGCNFFLWSEATQERMMRACRAAIDIKGKDFNQLTKPPTKGQQFVGSGIPFACNGDSATAAYFADLGFKLAEPGETERLFARSYFQETRDFAKVVRERTSLAGSGAHLSPLDFQSLF